MTKKESPGRDQRTGGDSHSADSLRARGEAAAMVAAAQARTRLVENALTATLGMIVEKVPLTDAQRERITELIREGRGPL